MKKILKKLIKLIKSFIVTFYYKLIYCKKIKINAINILNGKLIINIKNNSKIIIGKKLCIDGPLYLRSENNANLIIGDYCYFNHNVSITSLDSITVGNNCMFGNNVVIVDHDHLYDSNKNYGNKFKKEKIVIGNNVWIGANVVILKGSQIGNNSIIAAGSVVKGKIPDNEIYGGTPAVFIKKK